MATLETKCKVVSCRSLAALEPDKRDILAKCFGRHGAEAIILASVPGAVLWTDDHVQALFARNEHGVLRVWTQFVIGARAESGAINIEAFFDASARLLGFGYFFTSVNPQILRHAAILTDWKAGGWPFSQALTIFEHQAVDLPVVMQLAAGFLQLLYLESLLPATQNAVTVQILQHITKRQHSIAAIQGLRNALPRIFGLNIVGLVSAVQTIDAWLHSR